MNSAPAELLHPLSNIHTMQHFSYGSAFLGQSKLAAMTPGVHRFAKKNAGTFMPASEYCLQKTSLFSKKTPPSPIESA